jgi:hypothetical protein
VGWWDRDPTMKYMGNIWEIYGKHMGNIWGIYGEYMGNIWEYMFYKRFNQQLLGFMQQTYGCRFFLNGKLVDDCYLFLGNGDLMVIE